MAAVLDEDDEALEAAIVAVLANEPINDVELRLRRPEPGHERRTEGGHERRAEAGHESSGGERVCLLSLRALTDATGAVNGAVGCLSDVTEGVLLRHELEAKASTDALTGCLNRSATLSVLVRATAASAAAGRGLALVFIDLDDFKSVNDLYGHAAGDRLLVAAADRLRASVRDRDEIGRLGGDEFLVICPGVESAEQAARIAERLATSIEARVDVGPGIVDLHASLGVAWTDEGLDMDALIAQADTAMYESKRLGLHGVSLFTPAAPE